MTDEKVKYNPGEIICVPNFIESLDHEYGLLIDKYGELKKKYDILLDYVKSLKFHNDRDASWLEVRLIVKNAQLLLKEIGENE